MQAVNTRMTLSKVVLTVVIATDQTPNAAPLVIELGNVIVRDYQATGSPSAAGVGNEQFTLDYDHWGVTFLAGGLVSVASAEPSGYVCVR